jgi:uncharacterized metal-binding protein YceD (DUF177 family)
MDTLLINLGELPDEGQQLKGALDPEIFGLSEGDVRPLGPLEFDLHVERFETELLFRGSLSALFEFACVRDLKPFEMTISLPNVAISLEIEGGGGEIDAAAALREELLINFPKYPRCEDGDHPQPCKIDAQYLAVDKPVSNDVESPPAGGGDSRWDALDDLDGSSKES